MFGPKPGSWWVRSEADPRWDGLGRTESLLFSAGPPPEVRHHVATTKELFGEAPADLEWGGMKD